MYGKKTDKMDKKAAKGGKMAKEGKAKDMAGKMKMAMKGKRKCA
jgi:hypothetical protein